MFGVFLLGTAGYMAFEGWTVLDGFYMTIITISTVGLGEIRPLSPAGRVLTIGIIASGVTLGALILGTLTQMIVEGKLRMILGRRIMENRIRKLRGHFVVCGFGQIGKVIAGELAAVGRDFVIIEKDPLRVEDAQRIGYLAVFGSASEEETLRQARVDAAEGLVTTLSSDADAVFITLEAKEINPKIYIVCRSFLPQNARHLKKAGADRVISPDVDGGHRMAQAVLRSAVHEFLDLTTPRDAMELLIDEVLVPPSCQWIGKSIREADIRHRTGLIIVAIKRSPGEMIFNPPPETEILAGDIFVTLGAGSHQEMFEKLMKS
jgi:voltage-gated potassium channel